MFSLFRSTPRSARSVFGILGLTLLSACDAPGTDEHPEPPTHDVAVVSKPEVHNTEPDASTSEPNTIIIKEEIVTPPLSAPAPEDIRPTPRPAQDTNETTPSEVDEPAAPEPSEHIVLQDGVDAFLGYQRIDISENLSGTYPDLNQGIAAFILGFNLRAVANEEGASAWAKIRTSATGETTWQYELSYLPDDSVYAIDYKVYFEKLTLNENEDNLSVGYRIARIGRRVKCYRGSKPKQWTVELCP